MQGVSGQAPSGFAALGLTAGPLAAGQLGAGSMHRCGSSSLLAAITQPYTSNSPFISGEDAFLCSPLLQPPPQHQVAVIPNSVRVDSATPARVVTNHTGRDGVIGGRVRSGLMFEGSAAAADSMPPASARGVLAAQVPLHGAAGVAMGGSRFGGA